MAFTYQYGTTLSQAVSGGTAQVRPFLYYETTTTNTAVTLKVSAGFQILNNSLNMNTGTATVTLAGTGQTGGSGSSAVKTSLASGGYITCVAQKTWSWSRGTSNATKTVTSKIEFSQYQLFYPQTSTATLSVAVNARPSYSVSYNANGGSGAPSAQTKWYGTTLTLSATKPTRTGYTFKGWATSSSGSVAYQPSGSYTANAAVTLYAVWQINTWTVSYNANGGSGSIANQTKTYGVNLTLSNGAGFTRSLYNLTKWNTAANGSGTDYAKSATYTGNAALTLYAQWELAYVKPTISNFVCYRVASSGSTTATDDGEVIYISFTWAGGQLGGSTVNPTIVVTIGGTTVYNTAQSTGTGTFAQWYDNGGNGYDKDSAYSVSAKVYDSNYATGTTKTATIQTAIYLIDAIGSGANVYAGVMHAAVNGQKLTLPQTNVDGALTINNSVTMGGTLTIANHSSTVGTVQAANGSGTSLASGTSWVDLNADAKLTLSTGSWVVSGTVSFASNATGRRGVRFYGNSTAFSQGTVITPPASGGTTQLTTMLLITITAASSDVYLQAFQNSGSALTTTSYLRAMRIA